MARYWWWTGDKACPITASEADRNFNDTDAGIDDAFVVVADCWCTAEEGARQWVANRADENEANVPDGVSLYERERRNGKTYMVLWVDLGECRGCEAQRAAVPSAA